MKTLLLKYQGVLLKQENEELSEFYQKLAPAAGFKDEEEARDRWRTSLHALQREEKYLTEEEIIHAILNDLLGPDRPEENQLLFQLYQTAMMYGPFYRSAIQFLSMNTRPVCILTDAPVDYAVINLKRNNLHVNGVYSADMPKAHMCHKAFYEWVNQEVQSDCVLVTSEPEEAEAAASLGMEAFVMNHEGRVEKGNYHTIADLEDLALFLQ